MRRLTGSRLLWTCAWLASVLAVAAAETMPWSNFQGHSHWVKVCWVPFQDHRLPGFWLDAAQNILLFVPFGFTAIHAGGRNKFVTGALTGLLAAVLAASGELFQVYCHERFPSMSDVADGTAGALLGALIGSKTITSGARTRVDNHKRQPEVESKFWHQILNFCRSDKGEL